MLMVSERATSRQGISTREAVGACLFGGLCVCVGWLIIFWGVDECLFEFMGEWVGVYNILHIHTIYTYIYTYIYIYIYIPQPFKQP